MYTKQAYIGEDTSSHTPLTQLMYMYTKLHLSEVISLQSEVTNVQMFNQYLGNALT